MTNSEIIKTLSLRLDHSQVEIKRILGVSAEIIKDVLDKDMGITLPGLGTFMAFIRNKRKSFDPYHRRFILLPPKRVVKFHASSTIKDELKNRRI